MKNFVSYPLKSLTIAEENARKDSPPDADIDALAELIAAEGLQTPLNGYKRGKTQLAIYDGRRRLLALRKLAKAGRLPADCAKGIACRIDSKAIARQASLSADLGHRRFHPAEACLQFARLINDGATIPDIAKTYSMPERHVTGTLRLSRLAPAIFEAFAADRITLEQARAYTLVEDHDRQSRVFIAGSDRANASWIRRQLTDGEIPASDKRAAFIGADAYEAAGGNVRRDLFEETNITFTDEALLDQLTNEKLEAARTELAQEGWSETRAMTDFDHAIHQTHLRVHPSQEPLTEEAQAKHDALSVELEGFMDREDDLSADEWDRVETIETEMDAIMEAHTKYQPEDYAIGLAIVSLAHDGTLTFTRGLTTRKAAPKVKSDKPAMPHSVHRRVMEIATQCLARDLVANEDVADIIVTATLAHSTFGFAAACAVKISVGGPAISTDAELALCHALAARQERHAEHLTGDLNAAIDYVAGLDPQARAELRTLAVGVSLDLTEARADQRDSRTRAVGKKIAGMLGSDPTQHWSPDEAFFKKLGKPALIDALNEMGRDTSGLAKAKKGDLVPMAVRAASDTGWLPEPIRVIDARPDIAAETAKAA